MTQPRGWKKYFHQGRRWLAHFWLKLNPQVKIIGVTGSYGKTNTTQAIAKILSQKFRVLSTDLNLDTIYNLPITLLRLRPWHQFLVLEYGVDHLGEMDLHLSLVKPEVGVLTGISPVHSDPGLLGSLEGIIEEKGKLLEALPRTGLAVMNWDGEYVRKMGERTRAKVIWYGTEKNKCDFLAQDIRVGFEGTSFEICSKDTKEKVKVSTGLVGRHFVHACLVSAIIGRHFGLSWEQIKNGLSILKPLKGRLSIEKGPRGTILLNDALRANPASTIAGLQTLADLPTSGKKIAVLGEMGELGILAASSHKEIGRWVAKLGIDYLVSVGPLQRLSAHEALRGGMKKTNVFWAQNVEEAAEILEKIIGKGDLIYLKGSLLRHMERVILILEGKEVYCHRVSCDNYNQCPDCKYLTTKLNL
jgi:UDP-N-acetylmuramoyl-tripeptide--D-alanyl-D-alanine ligase